MILVLFIVSNLSEIIFSRTSDSILLALRLSFLRIGSDMMTLHPCTIFSISSLRSRILLTSLSESIPFSVASLVLGTFWTIISKIRGKKVVLISTWLDFAARMRKGTPAFQNRIRARLEKSSYLIGQRIQRTNSKNSAKFFDAAIRNFATTHVSSRIFITIVQKIV